ncbi:protein kil [Yersinia frederiksenii]|nr:protein kil [Yersinia frederiksenii]
MINHYLLRVAQGELAIAVFLGDGELWQRAMNKMNIAINLPWYRKKRTNPINPH